MNEYQEALETLYRNDCENTCRSCVKGAIGRCEKYLAYEKLRELVDKTVVKDEKK